MPPAWTRRRLLSVTGALGTVAVAGCLRSSDGDSSNTGPPDVGSSDASASNLRNSIAVGTVQQFNAPGCSCCGQYSSYLRENVDGEVVETGAKDVDAVKDEHGVPRELRSCHTLLVDDYVVEGHVPAEAIATLLEDRPSIAGIALPGMPAGSPGMGGRADGDLVVYEFDSGAPGEAFGRY